MRASTFLAPGLILSALVWAGSASPLLAETSAPGVPPAAAKGSDDALNPSTLPKARQTVKESAGSQVDELSPDERRRLDRMRARAAASKPAEKAAAGKPTETKTPRTEAAAPVQPKVEKPRPEQATREQAKPQQARTAPPSAAPRTAKAPPPARETAQAPSAPSVGSRAAVKAPPTRQAARRLHRRSRETADLDRRRSGQRAYPYRRGWPEVADRAPRVGDVVPPGTPLYPVPQGYGRDYPPFPGDYPPPRRGFLPW